jgi:hypothetical protein
LNVCNSAIKAMWLCELSALCGKKLEFIPIRVYGKIQAKVKIIHFEKEQFCPTYFYQKYRKR